MKIISPSVEIVSPPSYADLIGNIELAGRVCYKSEAKITNDSAETFVRQIIKNGHEAVLEHSSLTVRFICDRGVSHEIVRHRLAAYCQESTRYCNYANKQFGNEITVIKPSFKMTPDAYEAWESACLMAEKYYFRMLDDCCTPQEARSVLPNSLKTEIVMTANVREWRHFLKLRTAPAAHPQMREVALMLLAEIRERYPAIVENIEVEAQK